MNRYAGNKVPYRAEAKKAPAPKHMTLYSTLIPYIVVGVAAGLGVFAAQHPEAVEPYAAQVRETVALYRAPYIPGVVEIDSTHQKLIDLGLVTVTKVPHGWKPGEPVQ